jgi:hypothetical protein
MLDSLVCLALMIQHDGSLGAEQNLSGKDTRLTLVPKNLAHEREKERERKSKQAH